MPEFVHLHNHSDYSLLDGAASIDKLVDKAAGLGMKHLALTDHGNMFGVLRFYKACKNKGINPIIGCEFYVAPKSRLVKSGSENQNKYYHLVLLAKNRQGYQNLLVLVSRGYLDGFYYKPRIDNELLQEHAEGLICTSACLAGEIPTHLLNGQYEEARKTAEFYRELFGTEGFYLELQDHGIPEQKQVNPRIIELSRETGIPLIATNDIHYLEKDHAEAQDILICIGTGKKVSDEKRMRFDSQEFYFKTPDEMAAIFRDTPEAISNTLKIAEQCSLEIPLPGPLLPDYEIPEDFSSPEEYMRHIVFQGLARLYPEITEEIRKRAEYELSVIQGMGFTGYFLIVWDFIDFARNSGIPVGPGRGSGAGSLVAYAMRITDIDPLKYNLLFERFLNPERISMPDFDVDFCFERRGEVIDYVTRKYGADKVGAICTFGTLKTKAVLKDVARVLDIPFNESNEISKLVPDGPKINLEKALEMEPRLKDYREKGGIYRRLIDTALVLEGMNRHSSTHACGMVIGRSKLTDYVPLYKDSKTGQVSTEFTMDQLEECGLVKMDFLGLKTLTLIKNTEKLIHKIDPGFDIEKIPEDDPTTFKMLGEGKSTAVFQFESSGMQGILKQAKPSSIEELIALNALYRPGPMQFIPQYIDSKMGRAPIRYPHPDLQEVLEPTYGVIVYQEQVMQVAQIIGGFSLGKADILRRAMGKKKEKEMEKMKKEFLEGAAVRGYDKKLADDIFEMLKPFAGYGFNKSHAAAYSVVAYKTAYLKANYPAEFMAANLTNEINSPDAFSDYLTSTKEMGIEILPPDINLSEKTFTVVDGKIFYGLQGIKNVGTGAVEEIIRIREEEGPYDSFTDFLDRIDLKLVNRRVIETLIQAGLFDRFGLNRATLLGNLEQVLEWTIKQKESREFGQTSLFDPADEASLSSFEFDPREEFDQMELLRMEKENLGNYFSGHPLDKYRDIFKKCVSLNVSRAENAAADKTYTLLGMIKSLRTIITKKGDQMAFAMYEDFNGSMELIFFPKTWAQLRDVVSVDMVTGLEGKIDKNKEDPKFLVDRIVDPAELKESTVSEIHIRISRDVHDEELLYEFRSALIEHSGDCSVYLHLGNGSAGREVIIRANAQLSTSPEVIPKIGSHPLIEEVWKE
ncbi:DNA polymerase III subunit alpha [Marispirochaeta aestuarii]|uniref:DNA polymerase III subunit alpha n=1 Tax=Marispirochaeta aestuarii TaxID=1963862 RepID=UPI0029C63825|nr:DNA polymerase III subunit alpha [Marispirochaeta aestuarii]